MQFRSHLAVSLVAACLLALCGCGTNGTKACNEDGCCGPGVAACPAPPAHLYATGLSGLVTVFPVFNGALGTPTSITAPATTLGMVALNNQFLYISDFQNSSLDAWSINFDTGALTTIPGSPFSLGQFSVGAGLAANTAASVVYVGDAGKIDALKADATGALTAVPGSPFASGTNLYLTVDPQNRFVFASDVDPPGSVFAFTADSAGALTPVAGSPFPTIPGFVGSTKPNEIVVDSTGSFVYTGLMGTNQVAGFSIAASGVLTPVPGSPFSAGSGPISIATVKSFLYVANGMDGTISGYSITPVTGVLVPLAGSPFAIPAAALTTDLFGNFLYGSGAGGISALTIDSTSGGLTPVAGSPFPNGGATVLTFVQ